MVHTELDLDQLEETADQLVHLICCSVLGDLKGTQMFEAVPPLARALWFYHEWEKALQLGDQ